ncbi:MAG: hypothetical protein ACLP9K_07485, partial [Nitrososphaerales archaeon]
PWRLDLYHPSQLRSQARSRKRELYAMKQGLEAHDLQSWEDVTNRRPESPGIHSGDEWRVGR